MTIHLHHSARNVQMQGSSLINGSIRAPVWLAKYFVLPTFREQANLKKYLIKDVNEAILNDLDGLSQYNTHKGSSEIDDAGAVCGF